MYSYAFISYSLGKSEKLVTFFANASTADLYHRALSGDEILKPGSENLIYLIYNTDSMLKNDNINLKKELIDFANLLIKHGHGLQSQNEWFRSRKSEQVVALLSAFYELSYILPCSPMESEFKKEHSLSVPQCIRIIQPAKDEWLRALEKLEIISDNYSIQLMGLALRQRDADIQSRAAIALGRVGDDRVFYYLYDTLASRDTEPVVVRHIANALVQLYEREAIQALSAVSPLFDKLRFTGADRKVRTYLKSALRKVRDEAIPFLVDASFEFDLQSRIVALDALGEIGGVGVLKNLIQLLKKEEEEPLVRDAAVKALTKIAKGSTKISKRTVISKIAHKKTPYVAESSSPDESASGFFFKLEENKSMVTV